MYVHVAKYFSKFIIEIPYTFYGQLNFIRSSFHVVSAYAVFMMATIEERAIFALRVQSMRLVF